VNTDSKDGTWLHANWDKIKELYSFDCQDKNKDGMEDTPLEKIRLMQFGG